MSWLTWNKSVLASYAETFPITVHANQAAQLSQCYPGTSINSLSTQAYMQTCSELLFASYISNDSTLAHRKYICQFAEKGRWTSFTVGGSLKFESPLDFTLIPCEFAFSSTSSNILQKPWRWTREFECLLLTVTLLSATGWKSRCDNICPDGKCGPSSCFSNQLLLLLAFAPKSWGNLEPRSS